MPKKANKGAGASAPVLSPNEILKHLESKPVFVDVPEWGCKVKCIIPTPDELFTLRTIHTDRKEFEKALFKASLADFTPEQLEAMEKSHGLKFMTLFNAVMGCVDLFSTAIEETNIKK